jgi:hypothetical protein
MEKWKFLTLQDSNCDPLIFQPIASDYTDSDIPPLYQEIIVKYILQKYALGWMNGFNLLMTGSNGRLSY